MACSPCLPHPDRRLLIMMLSIALVIAVAVVAALPSANTALCYLLASAITFATISGCVYKWRQERRVAQAARTAPALLLGDEAPPLSDSQTWPPPLTTSATAHLCARCRLLSRAPLDSCCACTCAAIFARASQEPQGRLKKAILEYVILQASSFSP